MTTSKEEQMKVATMGVPGKTLPTSPGGTVNESDKAHFLGLYFPEAGGGGYAAYLGKVIDRRRRRT